MRLRFTIRDLLWLTVVAALAVGWWLKHRYHIAHEEDLGQQLNQADNSLRISEGELDQHRIRQVEEMPIVSPLYIH
jgi:hypothetical protein